MKRLFLIDCPGVVYPTGETETELLLKGVVCNALCVGCVVYVVRCDECVM